MLLFSVESAKPDALNSLESPFLVLDAPFAWLSSSRNARDAMRVHRSGAAAV